MGGDFKITYLSGMDYKDVKFNPNSIVIMNMFVNMTYKKDLLVKNKRISETLHSNLGKIQDHYLQWETNKLSHIDITGTNISKQPIVKRGNKKVLFFSGGVDSFYSFFKHLDDITDLIFIWGHDVDELKQKVLEKQLDVLFNEVRETYKKNIMFIKSQIPPIVDWRAIGHGIAKFAIAYNLNSIGTVYVSGGGTETINQNDGTNHITDSLFSLEGLDIIHVDVCRVDKVVLLSENEFFMRHVRTCYSNGRNAEKGYNCGECLKCVHLLLILEIVDKRKELPVQIFKSDYTQKTFNLESLKVFRGMEEAIDNIYNITKIKMLAYEKGKMEIYEYIDFHF